MMRILKPRLISMASAVAMSLAISAQAGPYTDDLSKCLVNSTTESDRMALVQWIFSAAASHPAVKSIVSISEEQMEMAKGDRMLQRPHKSHTNQRTKPV